MAQMERGERWMVRGRNEEEQGPEAVDGVGER